MRIFEWKLKARFREQRRNSAVSGVALGVMALTLIPTATPPAWGQTPPPALGQTPKLPELKLQKLGQILPTPNAAEIATGKVKLDGYELFAIAAPAVTSQNKQQDSPTPINRRIENIEDTLNRIASSNFDPQKLQVISRIDDTSDLPVIYVNGQYLMTVTTDDAQQQGYEPERWANELTEIIKNALIRAKFERQPEYVNQQAAKLGGIVLVIILSSYGTAYLQRRLQARQKHIEAQIPTDPAVSANSPTEADAGAITTVQQQITKRQRSNLYDVGRRILQLGQVGIWGGGTFEMLGLFPYTRPLQPLVLSAPLKVLGIGLGIYVAIRITDVLIDRFFGVLKYGEFLSPEVSQRLALRVSTFSRVLKSITTIFWIGLGTFGTLSLIGVELAPVIAGAGIIGLAISFASQSLIKDMINGFLILLEDQYAVGDVIAVDKVAGLVEYMNLRITQLRNDEGRLITIPNGTITVVENLSKDWSRVNFAVDIAYNADLDKALDILKQVSQEMVSDPAWRDKIIETPEVLGVDEIAHKGITIRVWIKTKPLQQWLVAREFRHRLKLALDHKGISIGVPQQSVRFRNSLALEGWELDGKDGHKDTARLIGDIR